MANQCISEEAFNTVEIEVNLIDFDRPDTGGSRHSNASLVGSDCDLLRKCSRVTLTDARRRAIVCQCTANKEATLSLLSRMTS